MGDKDLLLCYHKGCGQKYNPDENNDECCRYHPGVPVFHDALKGWSCCKKRSTDFTDFLNIPGCTTGSHTNEKPPEPEKTGQNDSTEQEVATKPSEIVIKPIAQPLPRPSIKEKMVKLKHTVGASLQQALEKHMKDMSLEQDKAEANDPNVVKEGTPCKNPGCSKLYKDANSNKQTCIYHAGVPIFHEGMKYWSCCKRKTSDFNSFLNQEGCSSGNHLWIKKVGDEQKVTCRVDWHQTASSVTMSVFAKLSEPEKSWVEVNQVSLKLCLVFEGGKKFEKYLVLHGVVDPTRSSVKMLATKVEINLRKSGPGSWSRLELKDAS